jgi:hypothetical protein
MLQVGATGVEEEEEEEGKKEEEEVCFCSPYRASWFDA